MKSVNSNLPPRWRGYYLTFLFNLAKPHSREVNEKVNTKMEDLLM